MVKKTNKKSYLMIASVLLAVILIIGLVVGLSSAKYKTEKHLTGDVKFTVKLADIILIQEHEAVRQDDGSYVLGDNIVVEQSYMLMPGVDVPKDPFITVEGKTPIPAYLYVEVVEKIIVVENGKEVEIIGFPETIKYDLIKPDDSNPDEIKHGWTLLVDENDEPVIGPNKGKVYVYSDILTDENTETTGGKLIEFQILDYVEGSTTDTIEVSEALPRGTKAMLNFHSYICQKYTDDKVANFSIHDTAELTTREPEPSATTGPTDGASAGGN
jgi:hypothetical protein